MTCFGSFGSQHMGVSDLPACRPGDTFCYLVRIAARQGVYSSYAQGHIIQAQYFRDHTRLPTYYTQNHFLTLINGEVEETRNDTYKKNLASLANFVMIRFTREKTVVPSESSWFGSFATPDEGDKAGLPWDEERVLPMEEQPLYKEDWIGLRTVRRTFPSLRCCSSQPGPLPPAIVGRICSTDVFVLRGGTYGDFERMLVAYCNQVCRQSRTCYAACLLSPRTFFWRPRTCSAIMTAISLIIHYAHSLHQVLAPLAFFILSCTPPPHMMYFFGKGRCTCQQALPRPSFAPIA